MWTKSADAAQHADAFFVIRAISSGDPVFKNMPRPKQQELKQPELRLGEHGISMGNTLYQEFWEEQPQVWFNLLERKFDEYQIESNLRNSSLLLSRLTQKALLAV